jgi:hypothetical protein
MTWNLLRVLYYLSPRTAVQWVVDPTAVTLMQLKTASACNFFALLLEIRRV